VGIVTWYASQAPFADHIEPNIVIVAWLFLQDQPIYHAFDAAERYSLLYGPALYLVHAWFLYLLGPGLQIPKLVSWGFILASLAFTFLTLNRISGMERALRLTGLSALLCLLFGHMTFWVRSEPMLLFGVAVALWAVTPGFRRSRGGPPSPPVADTRAALARPASPVCPAETRGTAERPLVGQDFSPADTCPPAGGQPVAQTGVVTVLIVGSALALAVSLKFTAALYFLPILALVWLRHGPTCAVASGALALVLAIAPFAISRNVSFVNYLAWIGVATAHGPEWLRFLSNLEWLVFLMIPAGSWFAGVCLAPYRQPPRDGSLGNHAGGPERAASDQQRCRSRSTAAEMVRSRLFIAAMAAAIAGGLLVGSVRGAWHYHLIPFIPLIAYLAASGSGPRDGRKTMSRARWMGRAQLAFAFAAAFVVTCEQIRFLRPHARLARAEAVADLERIREAYPATPMTMGYGGDYRLTFYRPLLVFWGNPYLLDSAVVMEDRWGRVEMPPETIDAILACRIPIWVLPHTTRPFHVEDHYTKESLFDEEFRTAFLQTYVLTERFYYYDVWTCPPHPAVSNGAGS
jgi:hypothetical protein